MAPMVCPNCERDCEDINYAGIDEEGDPVWGCEFCRDKLEKSLR